MTNEIINIDFKSVAEIRAHQDQLFQQHIEYLNSNSAFYKKLFLDKNINVETISNVDQLSLFPTTRKQDLQNHNMDFLSIDKNMVSDWTTTSGTLGKPVSFGLSAKDLIRLAYNEKRSFLTAGCTPKDRIQLMVTIDKRFMAGLAYYLGGVDMGASMIRVGSGSPGLQLDSMRRFDPTVLVAVPSFLVKVLDYASAKDIKIENGSLKKIICIGEAVRDFDFNLNNLGKRLKEKLPDIQLHTTYASTEMATAMTECDHASGGHIPPELILLEVLDENDAQVPDGQTGEVTVTTLGVEAMPILRYRTGDIAKIITSPCKCGRNTARISPIFGRNKHMIKYKGTTLFPNSIYEVLNGINNVNDFIVRLSDSDLDTDKLTLFLHLSDDSESAVNFVAETLRDELRVLPEIELLGFSEIRKMKFPDMSRKPIKLIDNRKKKF